MLSIASQARMNRNGWEEWRNGHDERHILPLLTPKKPKKASMCQHFDVVGMSKNQI